MKPDSEPLARYRDPARYHDASTGYRIVLYAISLAVTIRRRRDRDRPAASRLTDCNCDCKEAVVAAYWQGRVRGKTESAPRDRGFCDRSQRECEKGSADHEGKMRGDTATIRSRPCNGRVNVQSRFVIPQVEEEKETESAKCKIPRPPSASNRRGVPRSTPVERIESRVRMQDEAAAFRQFKDLLKAEHGKENVNPRAGQFVRSTSAAACLSRPPTVPKSNATDASEACWQEEESAGAKAPRISCLRRGSSSSN
eukprot:2652907-Rhodomonas_salina.1